MVLGGRVNLATVGNIDGSTIAALNRMPTLHAHKQWESRRELAVRRKARALRSLGSCASSLDSAGSPHGTQHQEGADRKPPCFMILSILKLPPDNRTDEMLEKLRHYLCGTLLLKLFGKTVTAQLECCRRLTWRNIRPGEFLFRGGAIIYQHLFVVTSLALIDGSLDILASDEINVVRSRRRAGVLLGEVCMFEPADQSRRSTSVVCPQEGGNCNVAVLRRVDFYATRSVEPFCSKQDMPSESESESALGDRESDVETDAADTGLSSEVPRIQSAPSTDYGQKSPIFGGHSPMLDREMTRSVRGVLEARRQARTHSIERLARNKKQGARPGIERPLALGSEVDIPAPAAGWYAWYYSTSNQECRPQKYWRHHRFAGATYRQQELADYAYGLGSSSAIHHPCSLGRQRINQAVRLIKSVSTDDHAVPQTQRPWERCSTELQDSITTALAEVRIGIVSEEPCGARRRPSSATLWKQQHGHAMIRSQTSTRRRPASAKPRLSGSDIGSGELSGWASDDGASSPLSKTTMVVV